MSLETLQYHKRRHRDFLTYLPDARSQRKHFRSIVQAIKAGINIDRIFRKTKSECSIVQLLPKVVVRSLKHIDRWDFDVFSVPTAGHTPLKWVLMDLLSRYDLLERFRISTSTLVAFTERLEHGYEIFGNPYHNSKHAADVTQTIHFLIMHTGLLHWLTELEIFAMIIAAAAHDFEHTGTTNDFHVNTKSDLALLYNDKSPLENHHASALFSILQDDKLNILAGLSRSEYHEFRSVVVDMILGTDMRGHFDQLQMMRNMLHACQQQQHPNGNLEPKATKPTLSDTGIDKRKSMCLILHCADISNPAKPYHIHRQWTEMLLEEYFRQGDDEARIGLPPSPMMDRTTTLVPQSQIGFMDVIVQPAFTVLHDMFDIVTAQILSEFKRHGSRRPSASNIANGTTESSDKKEEDVFADDKEKIEATKKQSADEATDLPAKKPSQNSMTRPKVSKTPSWVECHKEKSNSDKSMQENGALENEEIQNSIQVVRVEEIMDRLKAFREKVSSIIDQNKQHWHDEKERDEQLIRAAQS